MKSADSITAGVRTVTTASIVLSVLMIAAGALAICVPVIAGVTVTAMVGWLLVLNHEDKGMMAIILF